MRLTKAQRKLVTALGIGALLLIGDRFILRGPTESAAADNLLIASAGGSSSKPATQPGRTANTWGARTVAMHLREAAVATEKANVDPSARRGRSSPFHLTTATATVAPTSAPSATVITQEAEEAAKFEQNHRLKMVMSSGQKGLVMVSDRLLRVGEQLDGWRLVAVTPSSTTFQRGNIQVRLAISDLTQKQ